MALADGTNCGFVTEAPVADPGGTVATGDNYTNATAFTSPADATVITEIGWWCDTATEAANFDVGVYDNDAGNNEPDDLIDSVVNQAKGTTAGWKKATGLNIAISGNTKYWLAVQLDNTATTTRIDYSIEVGYWRAMLTPSSALPDPNFGAPDLKFEDRMIAIYVVYTTAAGNAGIMTPNTGFWGPTF